ncbi:uncharacterized protein LOC116301925 [Actinia tenebrosa]|uniref:Uncharacterized protein LOC116301925 n=1 Tax=Actinia tenebrosa TaxID=6105 RepID=A0A6P8IJB3_ACTTE|nr:uncharacterized protein LOC116301925 [Actinia tenebrosa]
MKFPAFLLTLGLAFFLFAGTTDAAQSEKSSIRKDRLRSVNCRYVKENGYCKYSFVENELCYATCRCSDSLSTKSCQSVKTKFKCQTTWSIISCRYTCDQCSRSKLQIKRY